MHAYYFFWHSIQTHETASILVAETTVKGGRHICIPAHQPLSNVLCMVLMRPRMGDSTRSAKNTGGVHAIPHPHPPFLPPPSSVRVRAGILRINSVRSGLTPSVVQLVVPIWGQKHSNSNCYVPKTEFAGLKKNLRLSSSYIYVCMCLFFTLNRYFYRSTSSTTSTESPCR